MCLLHQSYILLSQLFKLSQQLLHLRVTLLFESVLLLSHQSHFTLDVWSQKRVDVLALISYSSSLLEQTSEMLQLLSITWSRKRRSDLFFIFIESILTNKPTSKGPSEE